MDSFSLFLQIGFRHIVEGYDHLLFLIGLIIVTTKFKSLLKVISAFTAAHSTTLILSALGVIALPPVLTESLIALSIVYVGVENIIRRDELGTAGNRRWMVAGAFGLIHGAGFSSHLTDLLKSMLGMGNIWGPLMGFNIGIELGQLLVIATVYPLLYLARRYHQEKRLVPQVSFVVAVIGAILLVSRVWEG